ncbi:DUF2933 domain-containing protein [Cupriavidus sp. a3]
MAVPIDLRPACHIASAWPFALVLLCPMMHFIDGSH